MKMIRIWGLMLFLCVLVGQKLSAQISISWIQLGQISFELTEDQGNSFPYPSPKFPQSIQDLNGKEVIIKGYMIPMNIEGTEYAISAYPNSACFFCGAAGQESVMRLEVKDSRARYGVDEYRTFKGKLKLNHLPNDLLYIMTEAVEVK
ncbi:MAG: DUF3299 domain-containing protein [Bacteroidia bacterium]|nr:DUF3299 domain-containing protein [Bacteroidia bacterium]